MKSIRLTFILLAAILLPLCSASAGSYSNESLGATPVQLQAGPTRVYGVLIINTNTVPIYVHKYDALSANVTVGTTTQSVAPWPVGANSFVWVAANGSVHGSYTTGLTIAATTSPLSTGSTGPSTGLVISVLYQ